LSFVVFDDALVKLHRGRTTLFRWDEIKAVREVIHPVGNRYRITTNDGRRLKLDYQIKNVNALGEVVMGKVMDRLRPRAMRQLEEGGTVNFGPLGVSREGLTCKEKHLPWEDVDRITVARIPQARMVQLQVKQKGKLIPWCMVNVGTLPNY